MALPFQEPFTGDGALSASWTTFDSSGEGVPNRAVDQLQATADPNAWAINTSETYADDQYAQMVLSTGAASHEFGVVVRATGTTQAGLSAYFLRRLTDNATWSLMKIVSGSFTELATRSVTDATGDVMRLEVSGTTLTIKRNGVAVGATVTDGDVASGKAGLYTSTIGAALADDWEGDNIAGGGGGAGQPAIKRYTGTPHASPRNPSGAGPRVW